MFISVRYGENDLELFNPDCYLAQLYHCIRKHCHCEQYDELLLMDVETCTIIHLTKLNSADGLQNGCPLFTNRGVYILMTVERVSNGRPIYKPLLDSQYIDEETNEKLKSLTQEPGGGDKRGRLSSMGTKKKPKSRASTRLGK